MSLSLCAGFAADEPRLIRSLSGPSGKVTGTTFVFDETRNRFVYPQDKSLTVYFEWKTQPGTHVVTAIWKYPDGKIGFLSPDVKIETGTESLSCYWVYNLSAGLPNGLWTVEVRMDGQPAGSHVFEIAGMEEPKRQVETPPPPPPKQPSLDDLFKATNPSMVWIRKLDGTGRTIDTLSGFVLQPNLIATAFQAIDGATVLQVDFGDGRKVSTLEIAGWSRTGDWAVLKVNTGSSPPIPRGDPKSVAVGERLIVFNVEGSARVFGGVDIGGRRTVPGFGERIQISPGVSPEAAGGPLLDMHGHVVAILGGSLTPGARFGGRNMSVSPSLWNSFSAENAATPVSEVPTNFGAPKLLEALRMEGVLTTPVAPMPEFMYGGATTDIPKRASDTMTRDVSDFSARDSQVWIYSFWVRKGKNSKGEISASVYDPMNRLRFAVPPKKTSLPDTPVRVAFSFSPAPLEPGVYRVDLNWDGRPVWRTFIRIIE